MIPQKLTINAPTLVTSASHKITAKCGILLPKTLVLNGETAPRHTFLFSDLQCLPPVDPIILCALLENHSLGCFFSAMDQDTSELFCCIAHDCSYRDEKLRERFVLHATKNCFQSSWRFLKFSGMYIQIETFMYAITSHKKRRAKYQTEMLSCTHITKTAILVKRTSYKQN